MSFYVQTERSLLKMNGRFLTSPLLRNHYNKIPKPFLHIRNLSYRRPTIPISNSIMKRTIVNTPTLGPQSGTKIINPFKSETGEILKVNITEKAADKLNAIKTEDKNPDLMLRISVESGGCHGFQYIYSLKNTKEIDNKNDSIFERQGAKFVIDSTSLEILQQSTIDYTTELIGSQFKVINSPFATSSCGCGTSFAFDPTAAAAATATTTTK